MISEAGSAVQQPGFGLLLIPAEPNARLTASWVA
jgi:hypothetical protein